MKPSEIQDQAIAQMAAGDYKAALETCASIDPEKKTWVITQELLSYVLLEDFAGAQRSIEASQQKEGSDRTFVALSLLVSGLAGPGDARAAAITALKEKVLEYKGKTGIAWVRFALAVLTQQSEPAVAQDALTLALDGLGSNRQLGIESLLTTEACKAALVRRDAVLAARQTDAAELEAVAEIVTLELPAKGKADKAPARLQFKGKASPLTFEGDELTCLALARGASDDVMYVAASYAGLAIVDTSNPQKPQATHLIDFEGTDIRALATCEDVVYVADYNDGVQVVDVSDPAAPRRLGLFPTPYGGQFKRAEVIDERWLLLVDVHGLTLFDIEERHAPRYRWTKHCYSGGSQGWVGSFAVCGDHVLTTQGKHGLLIFDISDREAPRAVSARALALTYKKKTNEAWVQSVAVDGERAYVGTTEGLWILDVSEPSGPETIALLPEVGSCRSETHVLVRDARAYVFFDNVVHVIALDGSQPSWLGKQPLGRTFDRLHDVRLEETTLWGAAGSSGLYLAAAR